MKPCQLHHACASEGVEVDGGVRLGGRLFKRAGSAEDKVGVDILVLTNLLDRSLNTTAGG